MDQIFKKTMNNNYKKRKFFNFSRIFNKNRKKKTTSIQIRLQINNLIWILVITIIVKTMNLVFVMKIKIYKKSYYYKINKIIIKINKVYKGLI